MTDLKLTTDAKIPSGESITVTIYEDTNGDGNPENSNSQSIGNGTNTYNVSGFDTSSGNDVWFKADFSTASSNAPSLSSVDVESAVSPPSKPQNVSATVDSNDQITLTWDEVSNWNGDVGSYNIDISRDGASYTTPAGGPSTVSGGSTSYSETYGPSSDSSYGSAVGIDSSFQFRIRAENLAGSSSWVSSGTVYTDPIPPHNPSVSRPDSNSITLSADVKSDLALYVNVDYREDTGSGYGNWQSLETLTSSEVTGTTDTKGDTWSFTFNTGTSYQFGSLSEDARYQFRIRTKATGGKQSKWVYADYGNAGNVYFSDDFEDQDLAEWTATSGATINSGSGDANVPIGVSGADSGTYYAAFDAAGYIRKSLGDLSVESDVIVKAAVAVGSQDYSYEFLDIRWYDGSSWNDLRTIGWEYNRQGWVEVTALVPSSYLSTDNRVQFGGDSGGGGDQHAIDRVVVSDILHEVTTPVAPTVDSIDNSTEGEITVTWTENHNQNLPSEHSKTKLFRDGSRVGTKYDATGSTFTGLSDGEKYDLVTKAMAGQYRHGTRESWYDSTTVNNTTTTRLPAPTSLSVSNILPTSADAGWTVNHDYGDQRVYLRQTGNRAQMEWSGLGTAEYIQAGALPYEPQQFTAEFVAEVDALDVDSNNNFRKIIKSENSGNILVFEQSGAVSFRVPGVTLNNFTAGSVSADGTPHRVTCVYDQSDRIIYIDGTEVGRETIGSGTVDIGNFRIGSNQSSHNLNGRLRDVTIWDTALTDSEIGSGTEPPQNQWNNVIGYWPLDINNNGTTPDCSPYSNNGTINGPTLVGNTPSDVSGSLARSTTSYTLSGLLKDTQYEAFVQAATEHSTTRDY